MVEVKICKNYPSEIFASTQIFRSFLIKNGLSLLSIAHIHIFIEMETLLVLKNSLSIPYQNIRYVFRIYLYSIEYTYLTTVFNLQLLRNSIFPYINYIQKKKLSVTSSFLQIWHILVTCNNSIVNFYQRCNFQKKDSISIFPIFNVCTQ